MDARLNFFEGIWRILNLSILTQIEVELDKLGFNLANRTDNSIFYLGNQGAVLLMMKDGKLERINYRPNRKKTCDSFIQWAKDAEDFEIVFHKYDERSNILRMDSKQSTMFCMELGTSSVQPTYSIYLIPLQATDDTNDKVEVIFQPLS